MTSVISTGLPWARQEGINTQATLSLGDRFCSTQKTQLVSLGGNGNYLPVPAAASAGSEVFSTFNAYIPNPWREDLPNDNMNLTLYNDDKEVIGHTTVSLRDLLGEQKDANSRRQSFWKPTLRLTTPSSPDRKNAPTTVLVDVEVQYASLTEQELSRRKRLSKSIAKRLEKLKALSTSSKDQPAFDPRQWRGPTGCSRDWRAISSRVGGSAVEAADMEALCFIEHSGTDTQVKLWRDEKRKRIVVSFRGTDFLQWRDVLTDLKIIQEPWNITSIAQQVVPGLRAPEPRPKARGRRRTKIMKKIMTKAAALVSKYGKGSDKEEVPQAPYTAASLGRPPIPVAVTAPSVSGSDNMFGMSQEPVKPHSSHGQQDDSWMSSILGMLHSAYEGLLWAIPTNVSAESLWSWGAYPVTATASAASAVLQPSFALYSQYSQWGELGYVSGLNGVFNSLFQGAMQFVSPPVTILGSTVERAIQAVQQVQAMDWSSVDLVGTITPVEVQQQQQQQPQSARTRPARNPIMDLLGLDREAAVSKVPMVHSGFKEAYLSVRQPLMEMIEVAGGGQKKMEDENWRILCTGHSLGGALATLLCQDISRQYPQNRVSMYNFGAPRVGNSAFMQQYHRDNRDSFRLVNENDVVPRFPSGRNSSMFDYEHVGRTVILGTTDEEIASGLPIWIEGHHAGACPIRHQKEPEWKLLNRLVTGKAYQGHMEASYFEALNVMERARVSKLLYGDHPSVADTANRASRSSSKLHKVPAMAMV